MYRQLKSSVFSSGRSPRTRTKWQGSVTRESFLKTISCSRKLSTADYKISLNETYKTNLSEKRDFHNENLRWRTKWSHSIDEKPVTHFTETLQHANPDLYPNVVTIITILLTMPVSTTTPERSFRVMRTVKTYLRWKQSYSQPRLDACLQRHTHWCKSPYSQILRQKEGTSSFRISLSSTKISDVCN